MNLISRNDAWKTGQKRFFTGIPCKHGHVSERYVSTGNCIACTGTFRALPNNPVTKTLVLFTMTPADRLFVAHDLTPQQDADLREYLHTCLEHWHASAGLMTESRKFYYDAARSHRAEKRKLTPNLTAIMGQMGAEMDATQEAMQKLAAMQ